MVDASAVRKIGGVRGLGGIFVRLGRTARAAPTSAGGAIAYFGPDVGDAAVRRRIAQWSHEGQGVLLLAFSRHAADERAPEPFFWLGRVIPHSRLRRALPLLLAAFRLTVRRSILERADLVVARNLDIALLALFARWAAGSRAPLVYEVLDVNRSCTELSWHGAMIRWAERRVVARADLLVVSSPYFATAYYERVLGCHPRWFLFENKVPKFVGPPRDRAASLPGTAGGAARRWRIGLIGYLDDEKSWGILRALAEALPDRVAIHVRGMPYSNFDQKRFFADVERLDNVSYGGPYRNPEDLAEIYGAVDIVWSMDLNFPEANSKWLLTNSLYEAAYFGKPVLGQRGTATGEMIERRTLGWCLDGAVEAAAFDFMRHLTVEQYEAKRREIIRQDPVVFAETDEIKCIRRMVPAKSSPAGRHGGAMSVRVWRS
jgi:succinoglycan biosynthesis protein ExoL